MFQLHPVMPVQFDGLTPNPFAQSCYKRSLCRPCPWHCNDTIQFQIELPINYTAELSSVAGGGFTDLIGPGTLDSIQGDKVYYNFSVPLLTYCNVGEVQLQIEVMPPGILANNTTYLSEVLNINNDLSEFCCSYEIEFWNDCKLVDSPTVIYENGYRNKFRICGNLQTSGFQDVSRSGAMLPSGPKLCSARTREEWTFQAEATTDERHYLLSYAWQHQHIRFRKFGLAEWIEFSPISAGWSKGRQITSRVNGWEGSGSLTRSKVTPASVCC